MVGITKIAPGRMGNHLFQYHFFHQITRKLTIEYFQPRFPETNYFENMEKKPRPWKLFRKQLRFTSREIRQYQPDEFLHLITTKTGEGYDIIFDPPLLGEVFFDYTFISPREILSIKEPYRKPLPFETKDKVVIGLHFRGTDFKAWNEHASLSFEYYQKALTYCFDQFRNRSIVCAIFTDDRQFEPFIKTIDFLKSHQVECHEGAPDQLPMYDFYQMSECDVLISSPSTFAIFAGCLGKDKKIIHSKDWLDYSLERNDPFWVDLQKKGSPYYQLWKAF